MPPAPPEPEKLEEIDRGDYVREKILLRTRRSVERAREVYRVFSAEDKVEADCFEGRHQISGRRAYDFLWENLCGE